LENGIVTLGIRESEASRKQQPLESLIA